MRLSPWALIGLVLVAVLFFAGVALHSFAPAEAASCEDADESRVNGLITQAEKKYGAILTDEPGSQCALEGMRRLIDRLCKRANVMLATGDPAEAKKAYVALLGKEPAATGFECANAGLARIRKRAGGEAPPPQPACPCATSCPPPCPLESPPGQAPPAEDDHGHDGGRPHEDDDEEQSWTG